MSDSLMLLLLLLIPNLAFGFEFLPYPMKTVSPEYYLWFSAGLIGVPLITRVFSTGIFVSLMIGMRIIAIIAIFKAGFLVIEVAVSMGLLISIILGVMIENSKDKENSEDNIFGGFFLLLLIATNLFLIFYCFLGGWRLFV